MRLRHHQHVEHDDRRQCEDHRPDADGPENVGGAKALLFGGQMLRHKIVIIIIHKKRPRDFFAYGVPVIAGPF